MQCGSGQIILALTEVTHLNFAALFNNLAATPVILIALGWLQC